jgi:hypothetical protein
MPTTKLPDNGRTASQKIKLQQSIPLGTERHEATSPEPTHTDTSVSSLHRQIHDVLEGSDFKRNAAGKSGEDLKIAVAAAVAGESVLVEIISVSLADAAEEHTSTPYEAIWTTAPGSAHERTYFDV